MGNTYKKQSGICDATEDDVSLLEEWTDAGNDILENPEHEYDDYGKEIPFLEWLRIAQDPLHPENQRKMLLKNAMNSSVQFNDKEEERRFLKNAQYILKEEIILYRKFLAEHPGLVEEFEKYRKKIVGE